MKVLEVLDDKRNTGGKTMNSIRIQNEKGGLYIRNLGISGIRHFGKSVPLKYLSQRGKREGNAAGKTG